MGIEIVPEDGLLVIRGADKVRLLNLGPFTYHAHFHSICRQVYAQLKGSPEVGKMTAIQASTLISNGFCVLEKMVSTEAAVQASQVMTPEIGDLGRLANKLVEPSESLKARLIELTYSGFSSALEKIIEDYLGCFFRIDHLQVMRTQFSRDPEISFRWHRDFEPAAQLHVVLYLTESGELDANTIFTTIADSRRCAKLGYAYPLNVDRVKNINAWIPEGEPGVILVCPHLMPGDAAIFAASRILHRGQIPKRWDRDVVLFNILPSLTPWRQELSVRGTEHLFGIRSTVWMDPFSSGSPSREFHENTDHPEWAAHSYLLPNDA